MKDAEFNNVMAMMADAESRRDALVIEMVAAAVLLKTKPPCEGEDPPTVTITPDDLSAIVRDFDMISHYDTGGAMTITLTPRAASPESGQP